MAIRTPAISTSKTSTAKVAERQSIPAALVARISNQVPSWSSERLSDCTMTRDRGTKFNGAKADLEIYGPSGGVVVKGREFNDGRSFFWDA